MNSACFDGVLLFHENEPLLTEANLFYGANLEYGFHYDDDQRWGVGGGDGGKRLLSAEAGVQIVKIKKDGLNFLSWRQPFITNSPN